MMTQPTQRSRSTTHSDTPDRSPSSRWRCLSVVSILLLALNGCAASAGGDTGPVSPDALGSVADALALDDATEAVDSEGLDGASEPSTSDALGASDSEADLADTVEVPADSEVETPEVMTSDVMQAPADVPLTPSDDATMPSDVAGAGDVAAVDDSDEGPPEGCTDDADWPTRVLFIGNSYTGSNGGLNAALSAFAAGHPCSPGFVMTTAQHSPGGKKLHEHYVDATSSSSTLYGLLNDPLGWDIVVLQDQSQVPGFPQEWSPDKLENVALMDDWAVLIEGVGAQVVFFMTWGRRDGDPTNAIYATYNAMQDLLEAGYQEYAVAAEAGAQLPVRVAPVGLGWRVIHDNVLSAPVGEVEASERFTSLYSGDGSHPSVRGTYLASAVFFEFLTGSAASPGKWHPEAIAVEDKAWLDEAASAAIALP